MVHGTSPPEFGIHEVDIRISAIKATIAAIDGIMAASPQPAPIKALVKQVTDQARKVVKDYDRSDETDTTED